MPTLWESAMNEKLPGFDRAFNVNTLPPCIARSLFSFIHEQYGCRSLTESDLHELLNLLERCSNAEFAEMRVGDPSLLDSTTLVFYRRIVLSAFQSVMEEHTNAVSGNFIPQAGDDMKEIRPYWLLPLQDGTYFVKDTHVSTICKRLEHDGRWYDSVRVGKICMGEEPTKEDIAEYAVFRVMETVRNMFKVSTAQTRMVLYATLGYFIDDWSAFPQSKGSLQVAWGGNRFSSEKYKYIVHHPRANVEDRVKGNVDSLNLAMFRKFQEDRSECRLVATHIVLATSRSTASRRRMSSHGDQIGTTPVSQTMMFRTCICLMEVAVRLIWVMSGFYMGQDLMRTGGVQGMAQVFNCHERSFSCIYGIANVLRGLMIQEFRTLRETKNDISVRDISSPRDGVNWSSLLRLFSPHTARRHDILQSFLVNIPTDMCMY